jgi:hypothetical protein
MYVILDLQKNTPTAVLPGTQTSVQVCSISAAQQKMADLGWAQDNSHWLEAVPIDPEKQLALSWHAHPNYGKKFGTPEYSEPRFGKISYQWSEAILRAGYPIIIGETGDQSCGGTVGAPFLALALSWADAHGVSVFGWGWNA